MRYKDKKDFGQKYFDEGNDFWEHRFVPAIAIVLLIVSIIFNSVSFLIISILTILSPICHHINRKFIRNENFKDMGGCLWVLLIPLLTVIVLFTHAEKEGYGTFWGATYHLYTDCSSIKDNVWVRRYPFAMDIWILNRKECKVCAERRKREYDKKYEEDKEERRKNLIQEAQSLIKEYEAETNKLKLIVDSLKNGADPFKYNFDEENDYDEENYEENDEDEYIDEKPIGVPSRYW